MKALSATLAAATILGGLSLGTLRAVAADSVSFTSAQVSAGEKTYTANCSACHGAKLEGVSGPALRGAGSGLASDTVGQAFTFISTQMPAGKPGSLSKTEYVNVLSFILSKNGHQPGKDALTEASAKASSTKI